MRFGALPLDHGSVVEDPFRVRQTGVRKEHDEVVIAVRESESFVAIVDVHGYGPGAGRGGCVDGDRWCRHDSRVAPRDGGRIRPVQKRRTRSAARIGA